MTIREMLQGASAAIGESMRVTPAPGATTLQGIGTGQDRFYIMGSVYSRGLTY